MMSLNLILLSISVSKFPTHIEKPPIHPSQNKPLPNAPMLSKLSRFNTLLV